MVDFVDHLVVIKLDGVLGLGEVGPDGLQVGLQVVLFGLELLGFVLQD